MSRIFTISFFLFLVGSFYAQEVESYLPWDALKMQEHKKHSGAGPLQEKSSVSLELPLRDDFSQDHFPGNEWGYEVYWTGRSATRSMGMGIDPPTVGVVVLEGLDKTGYPYDFSSSISYGPADTLESVEVNLQDKEGVILSFYYQPEGNGEFPDQGDSLIVEFYHPGQDRWIRQWFSLGTTLSPFQHVYIEVSEAGFLVDGFKFRFRNYATLSGSLDHWILDYIFLGDNRSVGEVLIDVGFMSPVNSLLTSAYTALPWTHYQSNSGSLVRPSIDVFLRNLNSTGSFIQNVQYEVLYDENSLGLFSDPAEPSVSASSTLGITEELNSAPNNFIYPPNVNDTCADFEVNFSFSTSPDQNSDNDLFRFTQRFRDYYAYDDGQPERGYGLEGNTGVDVAYKVQLQMSDTIKAVDMYFVPISLNHEDELFYLTIWDAAGTGPGEQVYQDFLPRSPQYVPNTGWARYALQLDLFLDAGEYYFGWVQPGSQKLNIGNDKNINNNIGRLFYDVGAGWVPSTITGSLLIRPVVPSLKPDIVASLNEHKELEVKIWPVPAADQLFFSCDCIGRVEAQIFDSAGRLLNSLYIGASSTLDTSTLDQGSYHLILKTEEDFIKHISFVIAR